MNTVWIAIVISGASLVVGTIVTLSVAYMHRKQMRQLELHRADPTIPLVPPSHPFITFLRGHAFFLVGIVINMLILANEMRQTTPITRIQVLSIALATSATFTLVLMEIGVSIWDRSLRLTGRTLGIIERIVKIVAAIGGIDSSEK